MIENLPVDTTHISKMKAVRRAGGMLQVSFYAFKYVEGTLMVFYTDNDNEYPQWIPADSKFNRVPELFAVDLLP